ncbi:Flp family type IVb pilin [Marinobacter sp. chi1]|uniref:Flp family type IVb pilin n=1 Tax=Marinobacter suaedae TaxID=3057675 RepID=A0ABT8VXU1_9GAMM|nr:Flp family type IVb pilin [Marinobacter sp. chi1]MDO3720811.1 Flp family type IVb pilin [Marinobacter sp. chi1]
MKEFLKALWKDEDGLTAVEYAIAGGLVVGGMVGAFNTLGGNATDKIDFLARAVNGSTS